MLALVMLGILGIILLVVRIIFITKEEAWCEDLVVIIINGNKQKNMIVERVKKQGYTIDNIDSVKNVNEAAKMLGWDGEKTDLSKEALSELKKISIKYFDIPFNCMIKRVLRADEKGKDIAFLHITETEEIHRMKNYLRTKNYKCVSVLVENKTYPNNDAVNHFIDNYTYDYTMSTCKKIKDIDKEVIKLLNFLKKKFFM